MHFVLFDTSGGRLLSKHRDVGEIWQLVRACLGAGGASNLTVVPIVPTDNRNGKQLVVEGNGLAVRALANLAINLVAV